MVALLALVPAMSFAASTGRSRSAATRAALTVLGARRGSRPEIVFKLAGPVRAGTVISVGGPARPGAGGFARSARRVLIRVSRASWFFYQDLGPYQQYAHPGRVALVPVRGGRVWVSGTIFWPPILNGSLPAFMRGQGAYDGSGYRVFSRPYRTSGGVALGHLKAAGDRVARSEAAGLDPTQAGILAGLLASQRACVVAISADSVPGGFYRFARVQQTRAALDVAFSQLEALSRGFSSSVYPAYNSLSPVGFLARRIARGCQDVLVYLAGGGYSHGGSVNIGMGMVGSKVVHRDMTLSALRNLVAGHRSVHFEFIVDAPRASAFQSLSGLKNVLLVATPVAPGGGSFAYLPDAVINGHLVLNTTNPLHLLELTNRLLYGLETVIGNAPEVSQLEALVTHGKVPSALAFLIGRALGAGGAGDFPTAAGLSSPPQVSTQGFTAGTPPTLTVNPDSYSTSISAPLVVPASSGVLADDSDSAHYPVTVGALNGIAATPPLHGVSAKGAAVTLSADGSFTYDPATSASLQALRYGQTADDSFTYHAVDAHGGSGTATVTVIVSGVNRPPVLSGIEPNAVQYDAGTTAVPVTSKLTLTDARNVDLSGGVVSITSGLVLSEDRLSFGAQNGITGVYDVAKGVLTLSGTATVADYQQALRSVTFSDSNGKNPTTGARTITFQVDNGLPPNNLSNVVSREIQVNPNPPPIANSVSASTDKHTAIDINVLSSASDPDGDTLHVASVDTTGSKGSVSVNPDGTIHYDPNGQFETLDQGQTATDTFTYKVSDPYQESSSATVTVTIHGVNDPPVVSNIESSAVQYDAGTPGTLVTNSIVVSDPDDTTLVGATVRISSGFVSSEDQLQFTSQNGITGSFDASTGVLTLSGSASLADYQAALRSIKYADPNGQAPTTGTRTITFQVNDGHSSNNLSNMVNRAVQVNPNPPPLAGNVSASTDKHTPIDINVLSSAGDLDGDTLHVASVDTTGTKGAVSINPDGTIHYDPNGQFNNLTQGQTATDTFSYQVTDGYHTSNTATATITINGVNDPPVLSNIETTPASYRAQDPAIPVTSTLTVADDDDTTLADATVAITSGFSSANDMLSFINQNGITGSYNASTGVLTLSGTASLADYQAALRSVEFSSSDGSASPAARTVSFVVTDSLGATSATASRNINVAEANQPPVAINHSYNAVGNTPLGVGIAPPSPSVTQSGSVLNGDSDPDSGGPVTITGNSQPAHGTMAMNPDGTFTYTPAAGFSGTDSFTYTITDQDDPANPKSATGTVTITVGPVVWYVDNTKAAGNGTSAAPFNNLAAANSAAGAGSIVFLYQGNGDYTGGITLRSGEDLFGQPHGLTVNGSVLVPAGGSNPTITNSGGDGIDLAENADVEGVNVSGPSGNGIAAASVNDATVGGSTPVAFSGAGGDGIHVTGGNGTLDFAQTGVSGSTGHSILVSGRTGGTAMFGGSITDHGTGILLSSNTGSTTTFTGAITASTGANPAFTATGGGTVNATGLGSTLTTTTATALNVASTTLGSSGLNFQSISSNGGNPGINLSSTGSSGGLTVTGTGSPGSGGTIQGSAGEGIQLASTSSPSFTDMVIQNNAADGINGSLVTGLTLASSTVSGNGTQANVSGENDDGLDFSPNGTGSPNGLTGTVSITNSTVTGSANNNAIISDTSGSLNLTVTGSTFSNNNATTGNDGLHIDANNTINATVSVTGSTFANNRGDHFQFSTGAVNSSAATGTENVTFSNNTTTETAGLGGGVTISPAGNSHTTLTIDNNNIQDQVSNNGIAIDNTSGAGSISGTINGNTIGNPAIANSGSGNGIGIFAEGSETETLSVTNNNISQYQNEAGINFLDRQGNPTMNLTITGNTLSHPGSFGSWGLLGAAGATTGDAGRVCAKISGNTIAGSSQAGQGGADFELDQGFDTTINLPGYSGGSTNTGAVVSFIQGNNTSAGTPSGIATISGSGGGFTGTGTTCP